MQQGESGAGWGLAVTAVSPADPAAACVNTPSDCAAPPVPPAGHSTQEDWVRAMVPLLMGWLLKTGRQWPLEILLPRPLCLTLAASKGSGTHPKGWRQRDRLLLYPSHPQICLHVLSTMEKFSTLLHFLGPKEANAFPLPLDSNSAVGKSSLFTVLPQPPRREGGDPAPAQGTALGRL